VADLSEVLDAVRTAEVGALPDMVAVLAHAHALALGRLTAPPRERTREDDRLLTMPEVARQLRITEHQAREMGRRGELPVVTVGERFVRVRAAALEDWIRRRERVTLSHSGGR
jgi:excisionase family DNA binding protein